MEKEREMNLISEVLDSFRIKHGDITVTPGPSVTLYEFEPAIGMRMSKIRNLSDEFSAALQSGGVRVIAPMLGKGTVGIEVPNKDRAIVPFDDMLRSESFISSKMQLPLAIGKTAEGNDFIVDLADMPHLLVAGATGQGKSVGLNVIIASLLKKLSPAELKMVLVDPKQVEFTVYEDIRPYLIHIDGYEPICTEPQQALETLAGIMEIMEKRYKLLKSAGVRNIQEYNSTTHDKIPYIVVIVDEYGDLIMTSDNTMEYVICRLAQKARAVGIHLIISTQRPDVSVVTGNIKANFPTRIAFRTTTATDSRVILDRIGAEKLQGRGDMLYFSGGDTKRVQCAYISTEEVVTMCKDVKQRYGKEKETTLINYAKEQEQMEQEKRERARKELFRPTEHILDVALMVAQCPYYNDYNIREAIERSLGYEIDAKTTLRLYDYGIVENTTDREKKVLIRDEKEIRKIIEYYSS